MPTAVLLVLLCTQLLDVIKQDNQNVTLASRNFYGVLKVRFKEVSDHKHPKFGGKYALSHGQMVHGFQFTNDYWRHQPTPVAAFGKAGDQYRFYEINPDVLGSSSKCFTYLSDSPASIKVVLGDARIAMERDLARYP